MFGGGGDGPSLVTGPTAAGCDEPGGSGGEEWGSAGHISKLETGQRRAYPSTIRKLAAGLDVEPRMLLGGVEYFETEKNEDRPEKPKEDKNRKIGF